jgi:hypothetical protein
VWVSGDRDDWPEDDLATAVRSVVRHEAAHQMLYRHGIPASDEAQEPLADAVGALLSERIGAAWWPSYPDAPASPEQIELAMLVVEEQCQAGTV